MPVSINGSTGITNVDGSAGTPAEKGSTSATAGMFFPAANTVAFSTSSTEAMRIDSSQNVGIGTNSPGSTLDVNGTIVSRCPAGGTGLLMRGRSSDNLSQVLGYDNGVTTLYGQLQFASTGGGVATLISNGATGYTNFYTNGSERVRITSGGLLGINTTNPGYQLTVQTSTATSFGIVKTGSGGWARENYVAPNAGVYYFDYFATYSSPTQLGYISSNGTTMTYGTSSDVRMKENIVDAPSAMSDLSSIQIRSFDWKGQNVHQKYGVVAQELIEVAPDAVQKGQTEDDMWGVGYANLVPMLIKAIQEQQAQIEELKAKVAALEGK